MNDLIDLRSDTVTRPTAEMLDAMMQAPVGDIQYGDDPTVNALEERVAALLGKQRAIWMPSGTMTNQVALRLLTRPGDDIIVSREAHSVWHESGASAANAGVQLTEIGTDGTFTVDEMRRAIKPTGNSVFPPTTLMQIENTHNRMGGNVFPQDQVDALCQVAKELGLATYLDGARLWNASVAQGVSLDQLAAPFDMVGVSFSKGLGAPGGSLLALNEQSWSAAERWRRMYGGAMRQVGYFAAAADYALTNNLGRLGEDHQNARLIGLHLSKSKHVSIDLASLQTNIVVFNLTGSLSAKDIIGAAKARGVLINALGPHRLRMLTHCDVTKAECQHAAEVIFEEIDKRASG